MVDDGDDRVALLPEFVSSRELRAEFGVSQASVLGWCDRGLPYYRVGRGRWFHVDEVRAFLREVLRRPKLPAKATQDV